MSILKNSYIRIILPVIYLIAMGCGAQEVSLNNVDISDSLPFNKLANQHQKQAQSIVKQAEKEAHHHDGTQNMISNHVVEHEMQRLRNINNAVVTQVGEKEINKARTSLPQLGSLANRLKYGLHHTISKNGEEIIDLIRSLAQAPTNQQHSILSKLHVFAKNGAPEALHFFGFIFEYGLFGANKDLSKAARYYQNAAAFHYQPSLYNLALIAAYGRLGHIDLEKSRELITQAYTLGNESSYRVCGFASFISYRLDKSTEAINYARSCTSPLASFAVALYNSQEPLPKRVSLLRDSLSTGVNDAYSLIEHITKPSIAIDSNYTFCKYMLVNRYRHRKNFQDLQEEATRCVHQTGKLSETELKNKILRDQAIRGITGFVPVEINALLNIRKSNYFHYNWSVPYLPFGQQEVNLFSSLIQK